MTASLGKGICVATVGAFFLWNAGILGTTINSLDVSYAPGVGSAPVYRELARERCPAYFEGSFLTRNSPMNTLAWCEQYRDQVGGDLPMRRLADFLPDVPWWLYAVGLAGLMLAVPSLFHMTLGFAALSACAWSAWKVLATVIA